MRYAGRWAEAYIALAPGTEGTNYDNALSEAIAELYKAKVTHRLDLPYAFELVEPTKLTWIGLINNCCPSGLLTTSCRQSQGS